MFLGDAAARCCLVPHSPPVEDDKEREEEPSVPVPAEKGWHGPAVPIAYTRFTNPAALDAAIEENKATLMKRAKRRHDAARSLPEPLWILQRGRKTRQQQAEHVYEIQGWHAEPSSMGGLQKLVTAPLQWIASLFETSGSGEKRMQVEQEPNDVVHGTHSPSNTRLTHAASARPLSSAASQRTGRAPMSSATGRTNRTFEGSMTPYGSTMGDVPHKSPKIFLASLPDEAMQRKVELAAFGAATDRALALKARRRDQDVLEEQMIKARASARPLPLPSATSSRPKSPIRHLEKSDGFLAFFQAEPKSSKQIGKTEGEEEETPWWERMYARAALIKERRTPADTGLVGIAPNTPGLPSTRSTSRNSYRGYYHLLSERGVLNNSFGTQRKRGEKGAFVRDGKLSAIEAAASVASKNIAQEESVRAIHARYFGLPSERLRSQKRSAERQQPSSNLSMAAASKQPFAKAKKPSKNFSSHVTETDIITEVNQAVLAESAETPVVKPAGSVW